MAAGHHVVIAALQVAAEIEPGPDAAAERTLGFEDLPLLGGRHRFNLFDHPPGNHHDAHLQTARPADRFEVLFIGVSFHMRDLELGLAAGGTRDLIELLLNFKRGDEDSSYSIWWTLIKSLMVEPTHGDFATITSRSPRFTSLLKVTAWTNSLKMSSVLFNSGIRRGVTPQ